MLCNECGLGIKKYGRYYHLESKIRYLHKFYHKRCIKINGNKNSRATNKFWKEMEKEMVCAAIKCSKKPVGKILNDSINVCIDHLINYKKTRIDILKKEIKALEGGDYE